MDAKEAMKRLGDVFGIEVKEQDAEKVLAEYNTYQDLNFETLRGKFKRSDDAYILLAVENMIPHNGAWVRYIDHLKATEQKIVVQSVVNKRLYGWFLRNGFNQTKKHKDWVIWRKKI